MENTLVVLTLIFSLSLIAAIVLFKILKSTALVKKTGYQAGGALAGFIIIYTTLYYSYTSISGGIPEETVEKDYILKSNIQLFITAITTRVEGVKVSIYDRDKKEVVSDLTDSDGVVSLKIPNAWDKQFTIKFEKDGYKEETRGIALASRTIQVELR